MKIRNVTVVGLGALGTMYAHYLSEHMDGELRIAADSKRISKYREQGVWCNDKKCDFSYVSYDEAVEPADLIIFSVKFGQLKEAAAASVRHVGSSTIILSTLNGIVSEEVIGERYGMDKVLYCVAQGMDAVKIGNRLKYSHIGTLCFGEKKNDTLSPRVRAVAEFMDEIGLPYEIPKDMDKKLWGKLMMNTGVNQAAAAFGTDYGGLQREGEPRRVMIDAMREVMALSAKKGIDLGESDLSYWLSVLDTLAPKGKPSLAQDVDAGRKTEVELFAGTIIKLGKEYDMPTPANDFLYERIREEESRYKDR